jgi:broad specificity phosphatase PhoE
MKILIVRHAECEKNLIGIPGGGGATLTKEGIQQASCFASELKGKNSEISRVRACPTIQTIETANIIANEFDLSVTVDADLRSIDLGVLSGVPIAEARVHYPLSSASMDGWRSGQLEIEELKIEGMETPKSFYSRGAQALVDIYANHRGGIEIIVCTTSFMILFEYIKERVSYHMGQGYRCKNYDNISSIELCFTKEDIDWLLNYL